MCFSRTPIEFHSERFDIFVSHDIIANIVATVAAIGELEEYCVCEFELCFTIQFISDCMTL